MAVLLWPLTVLSALALVIVRRAPRGIVPDLTAEALRPLISDELDQGDPFVLHHRWPGRGEFRYYAYTTGAGEVVEGRAFPIYGSWNLLEWRLLGRALQAEAGRACWAPCLRLIRGLRRPFVMLYSRGRGVGEEAHREHRIYRADSTSPEGPFETTGPVTPPTLDFAIDPDVFMTPGGELRLTFATDFVDGDRPGTGLAEAPISGDLATLLAEPRPLARPLHDWQIFDARRRMPWKEIPGISWERGDRVTWHCIEGPATIFSPRGRRFTIYSGGCFEGNYATALLGGEAGNGLTDLSLAPGGMLIASRPAEGIFGPGHGCVVRAASGEEVYIFHARFGSAEAPRQMALAPIRWTAAGVPELILPVREGRFPSSPGEAPPVS